MPRHGAEEGIGEPAAAVAAEHEEPGVVGLGQQDVGGIALDTPHLDGPCVSDTVVQPITNIETAPPTIGDAFVW
jgi:hypothetical protein